MKIFGMLTVWLFMTAMSCLAGNTERKGNSVFVYPDKGQAKVVCLQVVNERIVRVRATSNKTLPTKQKSLMIVDQKAETKFSVDENEENVTLSTTNMKTTVCKRTGQVTFCDKDGKTLLQEANNGKRFWPYRVPSREIGVDSNKVSEQQRRGLSWQMVFDSPDDEAFYGLGQHQSEELNMKGKNEELFQYNTKVSVPFVISNKNYGILWDSYSYCRFGQPEDYLQLHRAFRLYDKHGREGHLTGTYTDKKGRTIVRDEDSIYYEYDLPATQQQNDRGGIKNLPKGFNLDGSIVIYEGFLENTNQISNDSLAHFLLYYAGYIKVYIGGKLVVPERWRTAWNPNSYKFTANIPKGKRTQLRIEWQPDGSVSYCGLRVARPNSSPNSLSVWSEMAQDMDYYFISGQSMDEVISGYRTLTGRAPVYPKWALGYWQSRERYKTSAEVEQTMAEFRRRHIPIDNIVQDWNYWPEDQWGSHQFEASRYPNPQAMIDSIHQMHGRFMISIWPKFYCNTDHYRQFDEKGWMYHQALADDIHDWVGPGYVGSFYDAYSEGARRMFWQQMDKSLTPNPSPTGEGSIYTRTSIDYGQKQNLTTPLSHRRGVGGEAFIDAWWMDASEPNVRDCTPMWYRKALSGPTALGTSTEYFNAYALVNAQAIYEGQRGLYTPLSHRRGAADEPRVFLLTRSGFAGLQRYSTATWSGDIGTRWEDMRAQMTAGMNYSLSGLPFWGMDQGGFCVERRYVKAMQNEELRMKNEEFASASPLARADSSCFTLRSSFNESEDLREWRELQTRWNQFGTFIPLFRSHGQWPLREPWHIAPDNHPAYQSFVYYDQLRYRLMPYLYSMAGWVHLTDYTMMRALVMDFGSDPNVLDIKDQWMFGPSLMVCPVSQYKARSRSVYFPKGRAWYDLYTGKLIAHTPSSTPMRSQSSIINFQSSISTIDAPYDRIPVFVPEGSIIPFGPSMEWSDEKPAELIHLYIYGGRDAQFTLYEDEGTNYNYERGLYATIDISYHEASRTVTIGRRKGQFPGMLKSRRFNIVYITKENAKPLNLDNPEGLMVKYDGTETKIELGE